MTAAESALRGLLFGKAYAETIFERFVKREIEGKRRPGFEPAATNNLIAFLENWHDQRDGIRLRLEKELQAHGALYGIVWFGAAKEGYLAEIRTTMGQLFDELTKHVPDDSNTFVTARASIPDVVEHFVYPEDRERYAEFESDGRGIYGSITEQAMLATGWVERPDGKAGYVRPVRMAA